MSPADFSSSDIPCCRWQRVALRLPVRGISAVRTLVAVTGTSAPPARCPTSSVCFRRRLVCCWVWLPAIPGLSLRSWCPKAVLCVPCLGVAALSGLCEEPPAASVSRGPARWALGRLSSPRPLLGALCSGSPVPPSLRSSSSSSTNAWSRREHLQWGQGPEAALEPQLAGCHSAA